MSILFSNVLGNSAFSLTNTDPFSNVQSSFYWLTTEYEPFSDTAWIFDMNDGNQGNYYHLNSLNYSWAIIVAIPMWLQYQQ